MKPFWIKFVARPSACVEAADESAAREIAAAFGSVSDVFDIPYPREPRIGQKSDCPSFCYARNVHECLGKTACPQRYSCTE